MVQYADAHLDASFAALADVTRRGVLEQQRRAYGLRDEEYLRLKILTCMLPEL